jgi:enoyl-CoA hydratase
MSASAELNDAPSNDSPIGGGTVTAERHGDVLLVRVDDGKANAFSVQMLAAIDAQIDIAEADDGIGAVVIAGNSRAFFAGFDLNVIRGGDRAAIAELVSAGGAMVRRAYGCSVPVVAACTGHAVAAGALLLLGCDHRVGPDAPVKIGLNEVAIALTLPDWAMTISKERLSRRHLQRCVANARLLDGSGAVEAGYLDEAVSPDAVVDRALAVAADLAETLDARAYAGTVRALRGDVLAEMDASVERDRAAAA